jgi:hypothetical protein
MKKGEKSTTKSLANSGYSPLTEGYTPDTSKRSYSTATASVSLPKAPQGGSGTSSTASIVTTSNPVNQAGKKH